MKYSDATKTNIASIKIDETTFGVDYFKFYQTTVTYSNSNYLISSSGAYFYQFSHDGSSGESVYQYRISDGVLL